MKLYTSAQIKELEQFSLQKEGIDSFKLMQRAAFHCFKWIKERYNRNQNFVVLCGPGNNGGDGLLIGAYLFQAGYAVRVYGFQGESGQDRLRAKQYAIAKGLIENDLCDVIFYHDEIIIDALFGIGLTRPLDGIYLEAIQKMNNSRLPILSIDIPSGMPSEGKTSYFSNFIKSAQVLTFNQPKMAFFLDEYGSFIVRWEVIDLGLIEPESMAYCAELIDDKMAKSIYRQKKRFSHKGDFGKTLLIGGSEDYPGAIILAAKGCLQSGVGKTFIACPDSIKAASVAVVPEAIYLNNIGDKCLSNSIDIKDFNCIAIGPGLAMHGNSEKPLQALFTEQKKWILDADALNWIASGKVKMPVGELVITPHAGEFDRLTKKHSYTYERWQTARSWSMNSGITIVLKGAYTSVFSPDGAQTICSSGNAALAKGGSGDLLCGLISGYMGRGYPVHDAINIAVYLHSKAADDAVKEISMDAFNSTFWVYYVSRIAERWEI